MDIIKSIEHEQLKSKIPELRVGNTVRVHVRIKEGNKERIQVFEGIIIKKQGGGLNATFTVRKISYGVGVEKTFLVHSPLVEKVEVVRVGKVRRAKLYYLRDRIGKASKPKEQIGARIENKEITVKEDLVEEPVEEVAEVVEETVTETVETTETTVEEAKTVEEPAEETVETPAEETAETTVEEAKTAEEPAEEVAETVEEVKEEKTEEPKAGKEEKKEETKAEKKDKKDN